MMIKKGDSVKIKPEYKKPGDTDSVWVVVEVVVEDGVNDRVLICPPSEIDLPFPPVLSFGINMLDPQSTTIASTYQFDPHQVKIKRHRSSTTQGEYSIFYRDQFVVRYGDQIQLTDKKDALGHAEWAGYSDEKIIAIARRLYTDGDTQNKIAPLCHQDVIALVEKGEAVVISDEMFDAISSNIPSNCASISNPKQVGTKDVWLVGTKEALCRVEPVRMGNIAMENLVDTLTSRYPEAGLSYGYIGNLEGWGDDRSWRVFTNRKSNAGVSISWGDCSTEQIPEMAVRAEKELETWVRRVIGIEPWPKPKKTTSTGMGM